jgi:hypothetical protein
VQSLLGCWYHSREGLFRRNMVYSKLFHSNWNFKIWKWTIGPYGITGYGVSSPGIQNYKDFCIKINIPKGNYRILRIGLTGSLSSLQKSEFLKLIISFFHYFWCQNWDQWHKMSGKNTHIYNGATRTHLESMWNHLEPLQEVPCFWKKTGRELLFGSIVNTTGSDSNYKKQTSDLHAHLLDH